MTSSPSANWRGKDLVRSLSFSSPNVNLISGSPMPSPSANNNNSPSVDSPRAYQRNLTTKKREIKELNKQLKQQDSHLSEADQKIADLKKELSTRSKDLAVTKRQFASLKKEKEEMESELAEEIKSLLKDNDGLKQKIHEQKAIITERDELRKDLNSSYEEIEKVRKELTTALNAKLKLEEKLKSDRERFVAMGAEWLEEKTRSEHQIAEKDRIIKEQKDLIDILQSETESVRREKFENVRNLAQFRTRCEELDTLLTKVQQQSIEYRGLAEAENTAKEQLEVTNKQLTSLLEDSRQQCADWTKVMAEERGKHQQREAEFQEELLKKEETITGLLESLKHAQVQQAETARRATDCQRELHLVRSDYDAYRRAKETELEVKIEEFNALKRDFDNIVQDVDAELKEKQNQWESINQQFDSYRLTKEGELNEVHVELRIAKRELVSLSMAKESEMKELTTELEQIKREFGTCRATHETELHAKDLEITGKSQELRKLEISKDSEVSEKLKQMEAINREFESYRAAKEAELQAKEKEILDLSKSRANCQCFKRASSIRQVSVPHSPSILSLSSNFTTRSAESALSFESAKKMGFNTDCDDEPMVLENNRIASGHIVTSEVPTFKRPLTPTPMKQPNFNSSIVSESDFHPAYQKEFQREAKRFRSNSVDSPSRMEQERMLELQRRNSLLPVALRSVYPVEFQVCSRNISEEKLKFADPNELKISMPPPPAPKSPNSTPVAKHQPEEINKTFVIESSKPSETPTSKKSTNKFASWLNRRSIASPGSSSSTKKENKPPVPQAVAFEIPVNSSSSGKSLLSRRKKTTSTQQQSKR